MLMLDLFSGTGSAGAAFANHGWTVVHVDNDPDHRPDIVADIATWTWDGPRPDLVWASPPCTAFSRSIMPWFRHEPAPSLDLMLAAARVVRETIPKFWVIENVRGAIKHLTPLFGSVRVSSPPVFLWGQFPRFTCRLSPWKERLSSRDRVKRAAIPYALSLALYRAVSSPRLFDPLPVLPSPGTTPPNPSEATNGN